MKTLSPILNEEETARFKELRAILKSRQAAFWEFAEALAEIRSKRLYRENYESFDAYCAAECGFTKARANQLIAASKFRDEQLQLAQAGEPAAVPETEGEARRMIEEAKAPEVTPADLPDPKATPVADTSPQEIKPALSLAGIPAPPPREEDTKGHDKMGLPLPKAIADVFGQWHEIQKLVDRLRAIKMHVEEAKKSSNPLYAHLRNTWAVDMENVIMVLKNSMPYAVCPYCQGRNFLQCSNCNHTGWVGQFFYERATTTELKQMRALQIAALK